MSIPSSQHWSATAYERNARFVPDLGAPLIDLLDPREGERILDLGCGDGVLTERIAQRGARIVGVDSAPELVAAARARGLEIDLGDTHHLPYDAAFDAVFSNAALHWMLQPEAVLAGIRRALVPGGRFVAEFGGHGNIAAIVTALLAVLRRRGDLAVRKPWYNPTPDEYQALLEKHGFVVEVIGLHPRPTPLPTGMTGWLETFAGPFLDRVPVREREATVAEIVELLAPTLRDASGNWTADYVRLRFRARI